MAQTFDNSRYVRETNSGQWKMKDNSVIVWENTKQISNYDAVLQSWFNGKTEITECIPQDSPFKCKKEMDIDVLLLREKVLDDDFSKVILCYHRKLHIKVKDDLTNIWLTLGDNDRIYIKDLLKQATWMCTLTADDYVTVKKISEHKIDKETAIRLKTGYIFSKEENDGNGNYLYGQFVAPKSGA
jgi:hypothetical protein